MSLIGYARVSSKEQNLARQLDFLKSKGCTKVFQEKMSGKNTDRPELKNMLNYIHDDDTVIVQSLDRLSRNYDDIQIIIQQIRDKGANFISDDLPIKDNGNTLESRFMFDLMLKMLSFVANNERNKIRERQAQGIKLAKERGVYRGRPATYTSDDRQVQNLIRDYQNGMSKARIAREYKMSRTTVYKVLRNNQVK